MPKHIYVSTDAKEAQALIEQSSLLNHRYERGPLPNTKYKYEDIDAQTGEHMSERIGFNPMCSIEINGSISDKGTGDIISKLVQEGLYVALITDRNLEKFMPKDMDIKNKLLSLYLENAQRGIGIDALFEYSKNPYEINDSFRFPVNIPVRRY